MLGLRYGDLYVAPYKKGIVVSTTTTHPAMAELFWRTFREYGRIYMHPVFNREVERYQWVLRVHLHDSFAFLLDKPLRPPEWALRRDVFLHFLAGFFDAEGSIVITTRIRQKRWRVIEITLNIHNTRKTLLRAIASRMRRYHPTIELSQQKGDVASGYGAMRKRNLWRIVVRRSLALRQLFAWLSIRHPEKVLKSSIAKAALDGLPYDDVRNSVAGLRKQIKEEVGAFANLAEVQCKVHKRSVRHQKAKPIVARTMFRRPPCLPGLSRRASHRPSPHPS
jgi:hypothetical protein